MPHNAPSWKLVRILPVLTGVLEVPATGLSGRHAYSIAFDFTSACTAAYE